VASALTLGSTSGCIPGLGGYSFKGGSFPSNIKTIAVLPFENETTRLELTQELNDVLRDVPRALGVTLSSEETANAVLRGRITSYTVQTPSSYRSDAAAGTVEVLQREVTIVVTVEIVDKGKNEILWETRGLVGSGQYLEASETEDVAMRTALKLLRQKIIDGAQSNW
jgi:hypothetical protein